MKDSIEYKLNVKKPQQNKYGKAQLEDMNKRHNALSLWGLEHIDISVSRNILDIGCGGGKNISNMINLAKNAKVYGLDYSKASVQASMAFNSEYIAQSRVEVKEGSAENIPYKDNSFDTVTAFETIYFWDIAKGFAEVYRILQSGGKFMITNEAQTKDGMDDMIALIGMNVYDIDEIEDNLCGVGFSIVSHNLHKNGKWLNVVAEK